MIKCCIEEPEPALELNRKTEEQRRKRKGNLIYGIQPEAACLKFGGD